MSVSTQKIGHTYWHTIDTHTHAHKYLVNTLAVMGQKKATTTIALLVCSACVLRVSAARLPRSIRSISLYPSHIFSPYLSSRVRVHEKLQVSVTIEIFPPQQAAMRNRK